MIFYFLLLTKAVYIVLPTLNKYLDGSSTFFLRAGNLSIADNIDFYPVRNNYRKLKLNIRHTRDFLTVNKNSKIIEIEEFNNEENQNFMLVVDVSGYIRIMHNSYCVEYIESKNYLLLRHCSRSPKQLFDIVSEKSVNIPPKKFKQSPKDINKYSQKEFLTSNFGFNF